MGFIRNFFLLLVIVIMPIQGNLAKADIKDGEGSEIRKPPLLTGDEKELDVMSKYKEGKDEAFKARVQEVYGKLSLFFIRNDGQMDKKVEFYEKGRGHSIFFTKKGVYLVLTKSQEAMDKRQEIGNKIMKSTYPEIRPLADHHRQTPGAENSSMVLSQTAHAASQNVTSEVVGFIPLGVNEDLEIIGEGLQEGKINYLVGNDPEKWKTNIPTYQAVVYKNLYSDVDMRFYGNYRQLKYDIIVRPRANPSRVRFAYKGIEDLRVTDEGDLEICLKEGKMVQKRPFIYQEINGGRMAVSGEFKIYSRNNVQGDSNQKSVAQNYGFIYGFKIGAYNKKYPLVIDPVVIYPAFKFLNK